MQASRTGGAGLFVLGFNVRSLYREQLMRPDSEPAFLFFQQVADLPHERKQALRILFDGSLLAQFEPALFLFAKHGRQIISCLASLTGDHAIAILGKKFSRHACIDRLPQRDRVKSILWRFRK